MDKKDLEEIRKVFREEFQTGFSQVWQGNLEPAFDGLHERIDIIQTKLDKALYREFQRIDKLEEDVKVIKEKLGIATEVN